MRSRLVDMSKCSPLRTGGAVLVHYPNSLSELALLRREKPHLPIAGALSNTVVFDSVREMISTRSLLGWEFYDRSLVNVLCGTMMPRLVRELARLDLGGFEYLASVPGTLGGGVFMNAGRGRGMPTIEERVIKVTAQDSKGRSWALSRSELNFEYRRCNFLHENPDLTVTSIFLSVEKVARGVAHARIKDRLDAVRHHQDRGFPNIGSVFKSGCSLSLAGVSAGRMCFSRKTHNWIINQGCGTAEDFSDLVDLAISTHRNRQLCEPQKEVVYLY